jgi:hypothetical protein
MHSFEGEKEALGINLKKRSQSNIWEEVLDLNIK